MFLVTLFLLGLNNEIVSGNSKPPATVKGKRSCSKDTILDTCRALKDDAQIIRREGYSAIDKADRIRVQAYQTKDDAYRILDAAYEIKESLLEERSLLENTLIETLGRMKDQATATNMYIQKIRTSLSSVMSRMDKLEQGLEEIEHAVDEKISDLTEVVSEKLIAAEKMGGELIPAIRVVQSTTYSTHTGPEKAIDGNQRTGSRTKCDQPQPWFKYYFAEERAVGQIKIVNGKLNENRVRLNGVRVSVLATDLHRTSCRVDTVSVRDGDTLDAQTYYLDCTGNTGIGVEFVSDNTTCLEFRDIKVYAP